MTNPFLTRIEKIQKFSLSRIDYDLAQYASLNDDLYGKMKGRLAKEKISDFEEYLASQNPITRLQAKNFLFQVRRIVDNLSFMFREGDALRPPPILLATAFSGRLTGQILHREQQGYAIIIDEALLMHAGVFSKVLVDVLIPCSLGDNDMYTKDQEKIFLRIKNAQFCQSIFDDSLMSHVSEGSASFAKYTPLPTESHKVQLWSCLTEAIIQFVVAHELGHIKARHLESADYSQPPSENTGPMSAARRKHFLEHEADYHAFCACIAAEPIREKISLKLFAVFSYLYFMEALSRTLELVVLGFDEFERIYSKDIFSMSTLGATAHPPCVIRAATIQQFVWHSGISSISKNTIKVVNECARTAVTCLWGNFVEKLKKAGDTAVQVSNMHKNEISQIRNTSYVVLGDKS